MHFQVLFIKGCISDVLTNCRGSIVYLAMYPIAAIIFVAHVVSASGKENVYFSLIISGGENGYRSSGGIPSVNIALEAVERQQLLRDYNLTYEAIRNSKVSHTIIHRFAFSLSLHASNFFVNRPLQSVILN